MNQRRAPSVDRYADWVKQAVFEVEGLALMDSVPRFADEIPFRTLPKHPNETN
jgi:hypothetical protein